MSFRIKSGIKFSLTPLFNVINHTVQNQVLISTFSHFPISTLLPDPNIPELYDGAVSQEADVTGGPEKTGMVPVVHGAVPAGSMDIPLCNDISVEHHLDIAVFDDDLFIVPLTGWFQ
jgi:hypothetical protein